MNLLLRAVITGFGLKLGSELAKLISARVRKVAEGREDSSDEGESEGDSQDEGDDDMPSTLPPDPPLI